MVEVRPAAPPRMNRKTPQQKKAESYAQDRRSIFGNNDKAARTTIPRNKRHRAQAERRLAKQLLGCADAAIREESMIGAVAAKRRRAWRKWPDEPLGVVLARKGTGPAAHKGAA